MDSRTRLLAQTVARSSLECVPNATDRSTAQHARTRACLRRGSWLQRMWIPLHPRKASRPIVSIDFLVFLLAVGVTSTNGPGARGHLAGNEEFYLRSGDPYGNGHGALRFAQRVK